MSTSLAKIQLEVFLDRVLLQHEKEPFRYAHGKLINDEGFPRRNNLHYMHVDELKIRQQILDIENLGAHTTLTDVIVKLGQAKDTLSDYLDLVFYNKYMSQN